MAVVALGLVALPAFDAYSFAGIVFRGILPIQALFAPDLGFKRKRIISVKIHCYYAAHHLTGRLDM